MVFHNYFTLLFFLLFPPMHDLEERKYFTLYISFPLFITPFSLCLLFVLFSFWFFFLLCMISSDLVLFVHHFMTLLRQWQRSYSLGIFWSWKKKSFINSYWLFRNCNQGSRNIHVPMFQKDSANSILCEP